MDVLESPIEALIFNFNFDFFFNNNSLLHSFFTFLAVLTAAFSFWKIKAVGFFLTSIPHNKSYASPSLNDSEIEAIEDLDVAEDEDIEEKKLEPVQLCSGSYNFGSAVNDDSIPTKEVKFTLRYDGDVNGFCNGEELMVTDSLNYMEDDIVSRRDWDARRYYSPSEQVIVPSRLAGDLGWYRYQDITSLRGSVVKLWDGVRRSSSYRSCGLQIRQEFSRI